MYHRRDLLACDMWASFVDMYATLALWPPFAPCKSVTNSTCIWVTNSTYECCMYPPPFARNALMAFLYTRKPQEHCDNRVAKTHRMSYLYRSFSAWAKLRPCQHGLKYGKRAKSWGILCVLTTLAKAARAHVMCPAQIFSDILQVLSFSRTLCRARDMPYFLHMWCVSLTYVTCDNSFMSDIHVWHAMCRA